MFNFGNTGATADRTYSYSYIAWSSYIDKYVRNRLLTATVTPAGGAALTLASNTYDGGGCGCLPPPPNQPRQWVQPEGPRGNLTTAAGPGTSTCISYDSVGNAVRANRDGLQTDIGSGAATN